MGSFFNLHWQITQTPMAQATRGVGNMLPQKILKSWCSETSFLMFWEDKLCLKCSILVPIFLFTTLHTSTPISGVHYYCTWNYRRLMLRYQKGKNGWETTEKWQRIVLKRLVEQRKHCLSLARKCFKIQENIKRKWEVRNICRKQEVSRQNERVGISLEFHCKDFFLLKSVCTWYVFLKSPIHPLKVKWPAPYDHFLHPSAIKLANG